MFGTFTIQQRFGHKTVSALTTALILLAALLLAILGTSTALAAEVTPGELIVGFDNNTSRSESRAVVNAADASIDQRLPQIDAAVVSVDDGQTLSEAISALEQSQGVSYVEPNYSLHATAMTNDSLLTSLALWGTLKVKAPEAWDISTGAGVVVAVTDSGINVNHPELAARIWQNPADPQNGIDDDNNGFVDDTHGADWANGDGDPSDDEGHGTHVSGTIAAQANDGLGHVGVAPDSTIMALKFLDADGNGDIGGAIEAIDYAIAHGANVINASWGGAPYSQGLEDAIRRAGDAGIVMAVAAGNEGVDNDLEPSYPASYSLSNMVTVAATNSRNRLANFSNRGRDSVQIAAPGVNIISIAGSGYEAWSGTSMATPHVTGIAALLKAHKPDASAAEIVNAIVDGAKPVSALRSTIKSGGVANAMRSLVAIDSPDADLNAPDLVAPSSFLLRSPGRKIRVNRNGSVSFRWTQTHDADNDLLGYEIRVDGKRRGFVADPDIDGPRVAATTKRVKVKPGSHRWSVVAIDEAGNKRSASAPGGHGSFARISVVAH